MPGVHSGSDPFVAGSSSCNWNASVFEGVRWLQVETQYMDPRVGEKT